MSGGGITGACLGNEGVNSLPRDAVATDGESRRSVLAGHGYGDDDSRR